VAVTKVEIVNPDNADGSVDISGQ